MTLGSALISPRRPTWCSFIWYFVSEAALLMASIFISMPTCLSMSCTTSPACVYSARFVVM